VNALSARRGELYDVGRDSAGREHLRILNLRTEAASDFVISGIDNHGIEKALTYRYRDDSLYLLDEAVVNGQQSLRLSRLSRAGVATLLHTIGFGGRSSVFLTGTYDGSLLLAASDSTKVDHAEYFILQPTSAGIEVLESFEDPEKGTLLKPPDALSRVAYAIARSSPKADEIELTEIPRSAFRPVPPGQRDKILRWLD